MNNASVDAIGQAWMAFRKGQLDAAGKEFENIISRENDSIDAHYGLGLVRRAQSSRGTAIEEFQRCHTLVAKALILSPGNDRLEIVKKMVEQRLTELGSAPR